jgi:hypothetical protein
MKRLIPINFDLERSTLLNVPRCCVSITSLPFNEGGGSLFALLLSNTKIHPIVSSNLILLSYEVTYQEIFKGYMSLTKSIGGVYMQYNDTKGRILCDYEAVNVNHFIEAAF